MVCRQSRIHHNHSPSQPSAEEQSRQTPVACPASFKVKEKLCYSNHLANLYTLTSQESPQQNTHTPPHQEVSHKFQKGIRSWTKTGNNDKTPGNRGDVHVLAASLAGWPNHHLQIRPPGLPNHPC